MRSSALEFLDGHGLWTTSVRSSCFQACLLVVVLLHMGCEPPTYVRVQSLAGDCEALTCTGAARDAQSAQGDGQGGKNDIEDGVQPDGSVGLSRDAPTTELPSGELSSSHDASSNQDGGSASDAPAGPGDRVSSSSDASSSDEAESPDGGVGWSSDAWDGSSSDLSLPGERPSAVPDHCSVSGGPSVVLTFQNRLSDRTISFNWVNLSCVEVSYAKVGPGLTYRVSTFGGHTWRARDSSSGALMKELVIAATPAAQQASVP
jgi:hypothetical protein